MGYGACVPTVSAAFDLAIHQRVFPNKLLFGFVDLPFSGFYLLHPYMRWGRCSPFGSVAEVACRVPPSSKALSTCPSKVSTMKHSQEG